jgi:hypothetical protein
VSATTHQVSEAAARGYRIPAGSPWAGAWRIAAWVAALGFGMAVVGFLKEPERFPFSYLFGFFVALSLAVGSLFFVLVQYVTKAAWGVTVRRVAELFMRPIALFAVLAVPLVFLPPLGTVNTDPIARLFPWASASHETTSANSAEGSPLAEMRGVSDREPAAFRDLPVANTDTMQKASEGVETSIVSHKSFYLSRPFFLVRLVLYLVIWYVLTHFYFSWSTEQDTTRSPGLTATAQKYTPIAIIAFALTLTFFGFDWLLSLDATWYSTIFGVYIFAQCALFQMACLILAALALRKGGLLGNAVNVEHFHDMGKLLFGWIAFWTYIAFAQFFLTWYSNIPDEVAWFHKRWDGNGGDWMYVSVALVVMHFFVPFWFLMSRNIKRRLSLLGAGAACMVVMHVVEVYWVIFPNVGPLAPDLLDLGCLIGIVGAYLATVLRGMTEYPLVPVGDPRLNRALEFENA